MDYFDNITYAQTNKYITYNTYDTTNPLTAQKYSNIYNEEPVAKAKVPAQVPAAPQVQVPVAAPAQAAPMPAPAVKAPVIKKAPVNKKNVKIVI